MMVQKQVLIGCEAPGTKLNQWALKIKTANLAKGYATLITMDANGRPNGFYSTFISGVLLVYEEFFSRLDSQ